MTHAALAAAAAGALHPPGPRARVALLSAVCAVLPDADVLPMRLGWTEYPDLLGHRGLSHSLPFALAIGAAVALAFHRGPGRAALAVWYACVTASHGLLDGLTDGGLGIAYLAPFSDRRYFLPWTPVRVSPLGLSHLFTARGWETVRSEILWLWLPALAVLLPLAWRRRRRREA